MRLTLPLIFLVGCSSGQLDRYDPIVYVDDSYCPDQNGHAGPQYPWTGQISGYQCCQNGGQCPEDLYCYGTDECRGPLPPNEEPAATVKRSGK